MHTSESMRPEPVVYRGRLSFGTFFKVCFVAVLGFSLVTGLVFLLVGVIAEFVSPHRSSGFPWAGFHLITFWPLIAWSVVQMVVNAVLTGVIGYPIYRWLVRIRGGLDHTLVSGNAERPFDARRFMQLAVRHALFIPVLLLVGLAVGFAYTHLRTPSYTASAKVLVSPEKNATEENALRAGDHVDVQIRLLMSQTLTTAARNRLDYSAEALAEKLGAIHARQVGRSSVIDVRVASIDPELSSRLVNALVDVYVEFTSADAGRVVILERAQPPTRPEGPDTRAVMIFAALAGASLGLVITMLLAIVRYART